MPCCGTVIIRLNSYLLLSTITNSWPGPLPVNHEVPFKRLMGAWAHASPLRHLNYSIHPEMRHRNLQRTKQLLHTLYLVLPHNETFHEDTGDIEKQDEPEYKTGMRLPNPEICTYGRWASSDSAWGDVIPITSRVTWNHFRYTHIYILCIPSQTCFISHPPPPSIYSSPCASHKDVTMWSHLPW